MDEPRTASKREKAREIRQLKRWEEQRLLRGRHENLGGGGTRSLDSDLLGVGKEENQSQRTEPESKTRDSEGEEAKKKRGLGHRRPGWRAQLDLGRPLGVAHENQLSAWNGSLHDWIVGRPTCHVRRAWKPSFRRCPLGIWDRRLLPLACAGLGLDWMDGWMGSSCRACV